MFHRLTFPPVSESVVLEEHRLGLVPASGKGLFLAPPLSPGKCVYKVRRAKYSDQFLPSVSR